MLYLDAFSAVWAFVLKQLLKVINVAAIMSQIQKMNQTYYVDTGPQL